MVVQIWHDRVTSCFGDFQRNQWFQTKTQHPLSDSSAEGWVSDVSWGGIGLFLYEFHYGRWTRWRGDQDRLWKAWKEMQTWWNFNVSKIFKSYGLVGLVFFLDLIYISEDYITVVFIVRVEDLFLSTLKHVGGDLSLWVWWRLCRLGQRRGCETFWCRWFTAKDLIGQKTGRVRYINQKKQVFIQQPRWLYNDNY